MKYSSKQDSIEFSLSKHYESANSLYHFMERSSSQLYVCSIVLIDFLVNQIGLYSLLFFSKPYPTEKTIQALALGSGSNKVWLVTCAISLALESVFIIELITRMISWGSRFFMKFWNVFDSLIILSLVPLKLCLSVRLSLVCSVLVLLRLWRLYRYSCLEFKSLQKKFDFTLMEIMKEKGEELALERQKYMHLQHRLSLANAKLSSLLGEKSIVDLTASS